MTKWVTVSMSMLLMIEELEMLSESGGWMYYHHRKHIVFVLVTLSPLGYHLWVFGRPGEHLFLICAGLGDRLEIL